jgi:hypothetical protein
MVHKLRARLFTDGRESCVELDGRDITDAVRRVSFDLVDGELVSHLELWADVDLEGEAAAVTAALIAAGEKSYYTVGPVVAPERVGAALAPPRSEVFESFEAAAAHLVSTGLAATQRVYRLDAKAEQVEPGPPFGRLAEPAGISTIGAADG